MYKLKDTFENISPLFSGELPLVVRLVSGEVIKRQNQKPLTQTTLITLIKKISIITPPFMAGGEKQYPLLRASALITIFNNAILTPPFMAGD